MSATFLEDFYPTPESVIEQMLDGLNLDLIEDVLDLAAGRGVISDYILKQKEARCYGYGRERLARVDVVEINPDFHDVLRGKGFHLVHNDILTFETLKVYHLIIANFPFSIGADCLQRALALVERNGGHLRCLVNAETIRRPSTNLRKSLVQRLEQLGAKITFLPGAFVAGERPTKVDAALIKLHVEREEAPSIILDHLKRAEHHADSINPDAQIVEADFAASMVARFNLEARLGIRFVQEYDALKPHILDRIKSEDDEYDYSGPLLKLEIKGVKGSFEHTSTAGSINAYLAGLREKYWRLLINDPRFNRVYTSNVLQELQAKLTELRDYDFTLFNIGELIREMRSKIVEGIESSILTLFDELSRKFTYDESIHNGNVHYFNGWKTNKAYKINRRVILPMNGLSAWTGRTKLDYHIHQRLADMVKVFNYLSPDRIDVSLLVAGACDAADRHQDFDIDLRYFKVKFFKKGTAHITFLDEKLLAKFNIFGSQRKHWLPPAYGKKSREDMSAEERDTVDGFHEGLPITYDEVVIRANFFIVEQQGLLQLASGESEHEEELAQQAESQLRLYGAA